MQRGASHVVLEGDALASPEPAGHRPLKVRHGIAVIAAGESLPVIRRKNLLLLILGVKDDSTNQASFGNELAHDDALTDQP
jgi:hypothetical protein